MGIEAIVTENVRDLANHEKRISALTDFVDKMDARFRKLDGSVKSNSANISGHEQQIGQLKEDVADLRARICGPHKTMLGIYDWQRRLARRVEALEVATGGEEVEVREEGMISAEERLVVLHDEQIMAARGIMDCLGNESDQLREDLERTAESLRQTRVWVDTNAVRITALEGATGECLESSYTIGQYTLREPKGRGRNILWRTDYAHKVVAHWNGYSLLLDPPYQIETARSDDFWAVAKEGMRRAYDDTGER